MPEERGIRKRQGCRPKTCLGTSPQTPFRFAAHNRIDLKRQSHQGLPFVLFFKGDGGNKAAAGFAILVCLHVHPVIAEVTEV